MKSYEDVKSQQIHDKIKNLTEQQLLTVLGIKILIENFADNKSEWKLVAAKGKNFLKKSLSITDSDI